MKDHEDLLRKECKVGFQKFELNPIILRIFIIYSLRKRCWLFSLYYEFEVNAKYLQDKRWDFTESLNKESSKYNVEQPLLAKDFRDSL